MGKSELKGCSSSNWDDFLQVFQVLGAKSEGRRRISFEEAGDDMQKKFQGQVSLESSWPLGDFPSSSLYSFLHNNVCVCVFLLLPSFNSWIIIWGFSCGLPFKVEPSQSLVAFLISVVVRQTQGTSKWRGKAETCWRRKGEPTIVCRTIKELKVSFRPFFAIALFSFVSQVSGPRSILGDENAPILRTTWSSSLTPSRALWIIFNYRVDFLCKYIEMMLKSLF